MKKLNYLKTILIGLLLSMAGKSLAQSPCQTTIGLSGSVVNGTANFYAITNNTVMTGYYYWTFGNGSSFTATNNNMASVTYSANGNYLVNLVFVNSALSCSSSAVYTISINNATCSLNSSFSTSQAGNSYSFTSTSTGTTGSTTYQWNFGDGTTASGPFASHTYTASGTYNVVLTLTDGACVDTQTMWLSVCTSTISLSATNGANGSVNFSLSGAPSPTTTFIGWTFGDGTYSSGSSTAIAHSYTANGTYTASVIMSSLGCTLTAQYVVTISNITAPCNLNASFVPQQGSVWYFMNNSTGTSGSVTYNWNFGDGNSSNATSPTHSYSSPGTYSVTLTANNNYSYTCVDSVTIVISVPNCTFVPAFTYSANANGNVTFMLNSPANTTLISSWSFGDGGSGTSYNGVISHNYAANGTYSITLSTVLYTPQGVCTATVTGVVTVTNVCTADATFSLSPTGTPQVWNAIPAFPSNVSAAQWSWGDGSTSNTLYTSHTYSAAGFYTLCLTVTTTCGGVDTFCAFWNIYRPAAGADTTGFVQVNVVDASVGIQKISASDIRFNLSPNPNNGNFRLHLEGLETPSAEISVRNLVGQEVYSQSIRTENSIVDKDLHLNGLPEGIYLLNLSAGGQTLSQKLVITGN